MKLSALKRKYEKHKKTFSKFIKNLEESDTGDILDIARKAEKEVWQETDCLSCANCCKKMTPTLSAADKNRIARHLGLTVPAFTQKYLEYDRKDKDWRMQVQPCVFLDLSSNKCSIYDIRPDDCRGFPHLVKTPMSDFVHIHRQNMQYCPATFSWVEKMMERVEFHKVKK